MSAFDMNFLSLTKEARKKKSLPSSSRSNKFKLVGKEELIS